MTKKQLLFASAALAAVVATEGTTDAQADDVKVSTPATTQVALQQHQQRVTLLF